MMTTLQPRLLPDFAAAPTAAERAGTRRYWTNQQGAMFTTADAAAPTCAVCAGTHNTGDCHHGTAPPLTGD
jgi:hypothetical protein